MSKERLERGQPVAPTRSAPAAPEGTPAVATSPSLAGKVAVVTGASSGIGRAIALAFAEAGAAVTITYRANQRGAEETLERLRARDRRAEAVPADLAEPNALDALVAAVRRTWGRVDVWVNNAGADILTGDGARLSAADKLDRLLAIDLRGTVVASWKAVELMRAQPPGGVILNMAWDGVLGGGMKGEYAELFSVAKGGVYAFSRALARSVAPHIRVNVLAPGWIETAYGSALDPAVKQRITATIPLGRWGAPEDIAHAAVYLASDAAGYVTGHMLLINGGGVV
jgi:3-oxoacyl-[acyl-carrier protein] reductase